MDSQNPLFPSLSIIHKDSLTDREPISARPSSYYWARHPLTIIHLRLSASWIRDTLDLAIARHGPSVLSVHDMLVIQDLLIRLLNAPDVTFAMLRVSRMHCAVMEMAGKATRWPGLICDLCDTLCENWKSRFEAEWKKYGLRPALWGAAGRLTGVVGRSVELTKGVSLDHLISSVKPSSYPVANCRQGLTRWWKLHDPKKLNNSRSRRHGDLGFKAGDWWINGLFACHAGIIDLRCAEGGICYDEKGAYAVVLSSATEAEGRSPNTFTYRCKPGDKGRYRLTAAGYKSHPPLRVLRSHNLGSLWAPRLGIRYEGM